MNGPAAVAFPVFSPEQSYLIQLGQDRLMQASFAINPA